jgi:succinoglycan biosynthesis transport protein ExoP
VVSNTPAYPKKLPIVLIATLATMMLTSGVVVTGELLRVTAPRAVAPAVAAAPAPASAVAAVPLQRVEPVLAPAATAITAPPPAAAMSLEPPARTLGEIEQLAADLLAAGTGARKVTLLGTASGEAITCTGLALARALAQQARVVLVDLGGASQIIALSSVDPMAPGLVELMLGEASFSGIITKDQRSKLHLVSAGRPGADRTELYTPRLVLALDALQRVYDHVLLDAGNASDLPAELFTGGACAVVVPDPAMASDARTQLSQQLAAVGFGAVTMLTGPADISDLGQSSQRGVAA